MPGGLIERGRKAQDLIGRKTLFRPDIGDLRPCGGHSSGLVDNDGGDRSQRLERASGLHQHAMRGGA